MANAIESPMKTRNDVPSNAKKASIDTIQNCLVKEVDLYNATEQDHKKVKRPNFN